MKKVWIIGRLMVSIALIITSFVIWRQNGVVTTAFAVGDLTVNWGVAEGSPIFVVTTMIPGTSESHDVNVINGAASSRPVSIRGILDSETGALGTVLEIVIKADGVDIYGGTSGTGTKTVTQFLTESGGPTGLPLTTLTPSADVDYTFVVTFPQSAGDEFQNASIQFDLKIGINSDVPADCSEIEFTGDPMYGTSGNDRIYGTNGNDLIFGLEGNDKIFGHGGDDCIVGGPGNDELRGETGNDVIYGGEGNDLIIGAVGNDILHGGSGNDSIRGENGDDVITGDEGDDTITGGNGNDRVSGGAGNDKISAENGADSVNGDEGDDVLDGGAGNDMLVGDTGTDIAKGQAGTDTCNAETETSCEL